MELNKLNRKFWPYYIIIVISACYRFFRLMYPIDFPGSPSPLGNNLIDEGVHLMTARLAAHGYQMYVDVNAQQGPLFMAIYQLMEGDPFAVRVMSVIIGLIGIVAVIAIAHKMGGRAMGIIAGLFVSLNYTYFKESRHGSPDLYAGVLLILAFLLLFRYFDQLDKALGKAMRPKWTLGLLLLTSGLFFGLAIQTKMYAIIPLFAAFGYMAFCGGFLLKKGDKKGLLLIQDGFVLAGATMIVCLLLMFIYGFEETLRGTLLDNLHRPDQAIVDKLISISRFLLVTCVPIVLCGFAVFKGYKERKVHLLLIWICPLLALFIAQSLTWVHYFVLIIPPICILGAYGVKKMVWNTEWERPEKMSLGTLFPQTSTNLTIMGFVTLFIVVCASANVAFLAFGDEPIEYTVADDVSDLSAQDDYVICGDPIISIYADRDQPPEATNLAKVRYPPLEDGDLINITCEFNVQVVVFTYQLSHYEEYKTFIRENYRFYKAYDRDGHSSTTEREISVSQKTFVIYYKPESLDLQQAKRDHFS